MVTYEQRQAVLAMVSIAQQRGEQISPRQNLASLPSSTSPTRSQQRNATFQQSVSPRLGRSDVILTLKRAMLASQEQRLSRNTEYRGGAHLLPSILEKPSVENASSVFYAISAIKPTPCPISQSFAPPHQSPLAGGAEGGGDLSGSLSTKNPSSNQRHQRKALSRSSKRQYHNTTSSTSEKSLRDDDHDENRASKNSLAVMMNSTSLGMEIECTVPDDSMREMPSDEERVQTENKRSKPAAAAHRENGNKFVTSSYAPAAPPRTLTPIPSPVDAITPLSDEVHQASNPKSNATPLEDILGEFRRTHSRNREAGRRSPSPGSDDDETGNRRPQLDHRSGETRRSSPLSQQVRRLILSRSKMTSTPPPLICSVEASPMQLSSLGTRNTNSATSPPARNFMSRRLSELQQAAAAERNKKLTSSPFSRRPPSNDDRRAPGSSSLASLFAVPASELVMKSTASPPVPTPPNLAGVDDITLTTTCGNPSRLAADLTTVLKGSLVCGND